VGAAVAVVSVEEVLVVEAAAAQVRVLGAHGAVEPEAVGEVSALKMKVDPAVHRFSRLRELCTSPATKMRPRVARRI
jgi:hypothetical protein